MRELSNCNKRLYLIRFVCSGGAALKQSYLLFRLFTAMQRSLGVIWLRDSGSCTSFDSRSDLMDKLNQYKSSVLGVAHEG
jgi:hypothetical protein